ncbi:MAG: hypothetical protein ABI586_01500, partial [Candidatus Nanopelagicales bacterium]
MTAPDLLMAGSDRPARQPRRPPSRWWTAVVTLVLVATAALAFRELAPFSSSAPQTDVEVLVVQTSQSGGDRLSWVNADGGDAVVLSEDSTVDEVYVDRGITWVQVPNTDQVFADSVVAYGLDGVSAQVGEADRLVIDPNGGVWLVVDSTSHTRGAVALASSGGSRSRLFTVPLRRQVVGATSDALVTLKGGQRDRRLQLWDPQLSEVVADLGSVTSVLGVANTSILVGNGCLVLGCQVLVVDAISGVQREVHLPSGWLQSGPPTLASDGQTIAEVVRDTEGRTGLAVGLPEHMT